MPCTITAVTEERCERAGAIVGAAYGPELAEAVTAAGADAFGENGEFHTLAAVRETSRDARARPGELNGARGDGGWWSVIGVMVFPRQRVPSPSVGRFPAPLFASSLALPGGVGDEFLEILHHLLLPLRLFLVVDHRQRRLLLRGIHLVLLPDANRVHARVP